MKSSTLPVAESATMPLIVGPLGASCANESWQQISPGIRTDMSNWNNVFMEKDFMANKYLNGQRNSDKRFWALSDSA
ncbi:hypothetical protein D3C87_2085480 [compost metagenome]